MQQYNKIYYWNFIPFGEQMKSLIIFSITLFSFSSFSFAESVLKTSETGGSFESNYEKITKYNSSTNQCEVSTIANDRPFRGSNEYTTKVNINNCQSLIQAEKIVQAISSCPITKDIITTGGSALAGGYTTSLQLTSDCVCKLVEEAHGRPFREKSKKETSISFKDCLRYLNGNDQETVKSILKL